MHRKLQVVGSVYKIHYFFMKLSLFKEKKNSCGRFSIKINQQLRTTMNLGGEKSDFFRVVQDDRKYIDDTIPMVSSDGEPHEILTLIAVGTGLVAAIIVLIFLILLIDCRNRNSNTKVHVQNQEVFSIFGNNEIFDARKYDCPSEKFMLSSATTILNEKLDVGETIFSKALPEISTVSC